MSAGQKMSIDAAPGDWPGWDQISGKLIGRMEKCPVNAQWVLVITRYN